MIKLVLDKLLLIYKKFDIYIDIPTMVIVTSNEFLLSEYYKVKERGVKIQIITEITSESLPYLKKLIPIAQEIRHISGLFGSFGISENDYISTDISPIDSQSQRAIHCNLKVFIHQQQYFYNVLWEKAIPIEQKIIEIEKGIQPEKIETIINSSKIETTYIHLLQTAKNEILLILPTFNSMQRHLQIGAFQMLKENLSRHHNLTIRILSPFLPSAPISLSMSNKTLKEKIFKELGSEDNRKYINNIFIRNIDSFLSTKSTILVVDRKESLVIEVKDDLNEEFLDSIGFGTYSNSAATVLSYISIFESFWSQSEVFEKSKRSEELQKQFISIASHELRNPIQPIIGLTEILRNKATDKEQQELMEIVINNAKKLKQITEDVLDITRIESQSLRLHKEYFDLNEMVQSIISEFIIHSKERYQQQQQFKDSLNIESVSKEDIFIYADKSRINQVISNLLNNAIKFTNGEEEEENRDNRITISIEKKDNLVVVGIKDNGKGIDHEIFPRLFEKFVTKSKIGGTGLGLFISKSIVEAHGGRIWAKNNYDGKGSTFGFSLPLEM